mmetsp:Transcript_5276/g.7784  ORF Transcript_5276/g.7784 Transcript_5276/m.7784 type:complete len:445 (+) Transcript_5276:122-1456(+)|eukprot:CAMPEP_0172420598 /NCGR_PEP_ID=MMETSP1064-20121228/6955_1 /TAXON_ID=202472 /ORGANISM="Aulacoseira subarctica , Strain CCAP 1002/5" /LENGTH=444 /DNA_ID=CAMNT_0013160633 /DNA_START=81 /DNA_END=1415 /DNA_ORIENTATION=+
MEDLCKLLDPSSSGKLLKGQNVMIPITSKGFFAGTLSPTNSEENKDNVVSREKERILLSLGGEFYAQMDRQKATETLRRRINSSMKNKIMVHDNEQDNTIKGNMKIQKGFLLAASQKIKNSPKNCGKFDKESIVNEEQKVSSNITKSSNILDQKKVPRSRIEMEEKINSKETSEQKEDYFLPFLEIREEYDPYGNEIKAEAVDVTKELLMLHKTVREQTGEEEYNGSSSFSSLKQLHESFLSNDKTSSTTTQNSKELTKSRFNDAAISSRLEQLAIQEENYFRSQSINRKSSKALQGKGWAKGFLTSNQQSRKDTDDAKEQQEHQNTRNIAATHEKKQGEVKVSFRDGADDVMYIPPNATRSKEAIQLTPPNRNATLQSNYEQTIQPKAFEHDIFSEYVMEKSSLFNSGTTSPNKDDTSMAQPNCNSTNRKLSRFARQRMESRK